jgi:hypothetical protein
MDQDTQDKARRLMDQLADSARKSKKEVSLTADQIKLLSKSLADANETAKSFTKTTSDMTRALQIVSDAFDAPISAMEALMDTGVESGEHLLQTFGALAGMMFDAPIKEAIKKVSDLDKALAEIPPSYEEQVKQGNDAVKGLEKQLEKEKDLCKKKAQCSEDAIKGLEDQIKLENNKNDQIKKATPEDAARNKQKRDDLLAQKKLQEDNLAKLQQMAKTAKEFIAVFKDGFDRFVQLDKAAASFRKELGLGRDNARSLEQTALQLNQQFATLGVTIEKAYASMVALGKTFGTSLLINKELAQTTSLLAANYGVSEQSAAGFLQKMNAIGGMTDKQASAMAGFTANLANAAGVNIDEVMSDVANASDETLTLMRGNVKQMTLAAVQARMMGVSLDKSAASAKGLLNFTQSVSDEMEASVLLGKNLNLNAARQLSFAGDVAGAQKEILNQVRQMGDLNKMNVFQQEALAKATGYSVADLTKMLANEEKLAKLSDKERQSLEKAQEALKEQNEETGKQLLMRTQMQSAMAQLSNTFQTFKQILADILTPVVNVAVKLLIPVLKLALVLFNIMLIPVKILANALYKMWEPIEPIVQSISDAFDGINSKIEVLVQGFTDFGVLAVKANAAIMTVGAMFGKFWNPLELVFKAIGKAFSLIDSVAIRMLGRVSGLITGFGSASGIVGRFASAFGSVGRVVGILGAAGKAIPFIGWIITGLQAIWGLWTRLSSGMNIFEALGETLYDVLVSPFELIVELLTKIPVIGDKFKPLLTIFPIIKSAFSSVFSTLRNGWESLKELFSGKDIVKNLINIGKAVLTGMYLVPSLIFNTIVGIFPDIFDTILSGVKSFGSILYTVFIQPWVDAWNFISDLFVGKSNSTLGDGIIKGLIGVGSAILKIFVSPFEAIFDLIIKGFTSIGSLIQTVFSAPFKIIGKLVGVDTGGIGEGAGEVGPSSDVIDAIERTNQKLDTLISLMMNGGIAVNLDGRKVSEQLAIASS